MSIVTRRGAAVALVALALAACPPEDQRTDSVDPATAGRDLSDEARAQLDSGNAAFRAGDHQVALDHFIRVTELAPDDATGWFGVYMAYDALGDRAGADSALDRARNVAPGASLLRDTVGDVP